jgi:FeS assembly SUF system protein
MPTPDELKQEIIEVLKTCYDPEIPVDIYELGLIYGVEVDEDCFAKITMTLTSPMCPVVEILPAEVETKARRVQGVANAEVDLTWEPPWEPSMMSEAARLDLGF